MTAKTGLDALLTPERSVLLLIDHQAFQFSNLHSHEPTLIVNNVVGLAKAADLHQHMGRPARRRGGEKDRAEAAHHRSAVDGSLPRDAGDPEPVRRL